MLGVTDYMEPWRVLRVLLSPVLLLWPSSRIRTSRADGASAPRRCRAIWDVMARHSIGRGRWGREALARRGRRRRGGTRSAVLLSINGDISRRAYMGWRRASTLSLPALASACLTLGPGSPNSAGRSRGWRAVGVVGGSLLAPLFLDVFCLSLFISRRVTRQK